MKSENVKMSLREESKAASERRKSDDFVAFKRRFEDGKEGYSVRYIAKQMKMPERKLEGLMVFFGMTYYKNGRHRPLCEYLKDDSVRIVQLPKVHKHNGEMFVCYVNYWTSRGLMKLDTMLKQHKMEGLPRFY